MAYRLRRIDSKYNEAIVKFWNDASAGAAYATNPDAFNRAISKIKERQSELGIVQICSQYIDFETEEDAIAWILKWV